MENFIDSAKEFFKDLTEPGDGSIIGWTIAILLILCILAIIALIVYGILNAINFWFRPKLEGYGAIIDKRFIPAHNTTSYYYNAVTKTSVPVTHHHPDQWKLVIEVDGSQDDFYVSESQFVKNKIGQRIPVTYTTGRLWQSISIKSAAV